MLVLAMQFSRSSTDRAIGLAIGRNDKEPPERAALPCDSEGADTPSKQKRGRKGRSTGVWKSRSSIPSSGVEDRVASDQLGSTPRDEELAP